MPTILDKIVATKHDEIAQAKAAVPESALRAQLAAAPPVRDFFGALAQPGPIRLIAEVKSSPSKGVIRATPAGRNRHGLPENTQLQRLTDEPYFQGGLEYLRQIRQAIGCRSSARILLSTLSVLEAGPPVTGSPSVYGRTTHELHEAIVGLGMTPLVELYSQTISPGLGRGARLIGINNRDLRLSVDLNHTPSYVSRFPAIESWSAKAGSAPTRT